MTFLQLACAAFVAVIILRILIGRAPVGYQDEAGFHLGDDPHLPAEFLSIHGKGE